MKTALIFGITGQDGSYLAEFLLKKKYKVHGVKRRSSSYNTSRIDHILESNKDFLLHYGDVTDAIMLMNIINRIKPDEILIYLLNHMWQFRFKFQNIRRTLMHWDV